MARTDITPTAATSAGVPEAAPSTSDDVNGNQVKNVPSLMLHVDNTAGAADVTVTFVTVAEVGGYAVEDVTVTVAMGDASVFAHFPVNVFGSVLQFNTSVATPVVAYV